MLTITSLEDAEKFVMLQKALGADTYWDNYDIISFRPDDRAAYSKHGAFRNGRWGFKNVSPVNDNGTWKIDSRNVISR